MSRFTSLSCLEKEIQNMMDVKNAWTTLHRLVCTPRRVFSPETLANFIDYCSLDRTADLYDTMLSRLNALKKPGLPVPSRRLIASPFHAPCLQGTRYYRTADLIEQGRVRQDPPTLRNTLRDIYAISKPYMISKTGFSVTMAVFGALIPIGFYYMNLKDVPFLDRKVFNCFSVEASMQIPNEHGFESIKTRLALETIEQVAPEKVLPEDHPLTIAFQSILKRLVDAGCLNDRIWISKLVNSERKCVPGPFTFNLLTLAVGTEGIVVTYPGLVRANTSMIDTMENEAELAGLLAHMIAPMMLRHHEEFRSFERLRMSLCFPSYPPFH